MPSVGKILREARLQAGLTIDQICSRTRIPVKVLQAIEEDALGKITSAFFYKSFVRQFSQNVGLPYERVAESVDEACAFYPEPFKPEKLSTVAQYAVVTPRRRAFNLRTLVAGVSFVFLLGACSAVYSYWEGGEEHFSAGLSNVATNTKSWVSGLLPAPSAPEPVVAQSPVDLPAQRSGRVKPESPGNMFKVELSAIEPSWLSIVADGRQRFSGILRTDQSKVFEGRKNGRVRTGNAGGLSLIFNGKPVGVMGPKGEVRVVVFTKNKYEVLDPEQASPALFNAPALGFRLPAASRLLAFTPPAPFAALARFPAD